MNIISSIKNLSLFERFLWVFSLIGVSVCYALTPEKSLLSLAASLIGVTALIFVAKGDVIGQALSVVFALFYALVSWKMKYYGEIITYLCMTAPIAMMSVITWIRNPYSEHEVRVRTLNVRQWIALVCLAGLVTVAFYFILDYFDTPNLIFSTLSVFTSFMASGLTMLRSEYYGFWYGMNDIVLIVLWVLASVEDISYAPMVACFGIFLLNDAYGFINWQRIKKRQKLN